jgi:predicted permease
MKTLRAIWNKLRSITQQRAVKHDIDEELRFHFERRTAENIAAGMSPEEAARAARKRFGNAQVIREECREAHGASFGETTIQDIRFAVRMLGKNPGYTAVSVLTLALGVGANTAIFSIINCVLLRPLPYRDPGRLVIVGENNLKRGHPEMSIAPGNLRDWSEQSSVFEDLAGQIQSPATLTGLETPEHVNVSWTTPNFFNVFGVPPLLGRTFNPDDKPPGGHRVAVLSYGIWQRSFGADHNIIGRSVTLNSLIYTVVGIMPPDFKVFYPQGVFGGPTGDAPPHLWAPYVGSMNERTNKYFLGFGRLKPGVTLEQAQAEIKTLAGRLQHEFPSQKDWGSYVRPLDDEIVANARPALRLLLGTAGFVLLIACANIANLTLARSSARAKEFAIRSALGAARLRLFRQLLVESTILALLGGALGVLFARWGLAGLMAFHAANLPRLEEMRLDGSVLEFTLVVSLLTALIFGLAPALQSSKPNLDTSLKEGGRGSGEGQRQTKVRNLLVVSEVALAMILMAGAGLMITSFAGLARVSPGFDPEHISTFDLSLPWRTYAEESQRINFARQLRERLQAKAGVKSVNTVYGLPFGAMLNSLIGVTLEGRPETESSDRLGAAWRVVSPNYFESMGASLLMGRTFSEASDTPDSTPTAIINEAFLRKNFSGENPVGKRIRLFPLSTNWHEIVGVVRDIKATGLDTPAPPEVYQTDTQNGQWAFSIVVRSSLTPRGVEKLVRGEVAAMDKDLALYNVRTMDQAISTSMSSRRFLMMLTGLFAALALLLTTVGIYGVVSYSVSRQTREIGIRMALGASRRAVLALVVRQGMKLALAGVGIGLAGSFALTRLIAAQLFGVSATDPAILALVAFMLLLVTLTACCLPARRAANTDPITALRCE